MLLLLRQGNGFEMFVSSSGISSPSMNTGCLGEAAWSLSPGAAVCCNVVLKRVRRERYRAQSWARYLQPLRNSVINHHRGKGSEPQQICIYPQIPVTATSSCYKDRNIVWWIYLALTLSSLSSQCRSRTWVSKKKKKSIYGGMEEEKAHGSWTRWLL